MSVSEGWHHFAIMVTKTHSHYVPGTYMNYYLIIAGYSFWGLSVTEK